MNYFLIFIFFSAYGYKRFSNSKSLFLLYKENQEDKIYTKTSFFELYEKKETIQIENNQTKVKKHVQPPKRIIDLSLIRVKEEWDEGEIPWDIEM